MCEKLAKIIESLVPKYIKLLEDCCRIESPTNNKSAVDACSRYLLDRFKDFRWKTEILEIPDAGNPVCITMNADSKEAPIVLSGHLDTVHPIGSFGLNPIRYDGDLLIAPGVNDCKGGVVIGLMAMEALSLLDFKKRPVKMIFQTDEETGSKTSGKKTVDFMVKHSKGASAFFNLEGNTDKDFVVIQRKGIQRFRFHIKGNAIHSAKCYKGSNAISEAAHKILELERFKDENGITCNCGVIEGGTVPNAVAGSCSFYADFRFLTKEQHETVMRVAQEIANKNYIDGCSTELENVSFRPGMPDCDRNRALFTRCNEILGANNVSLLRAKLAYGGSDAAYITEAEIPCLDNLGMIGDKCHRTDEYGDLSTLSFSAKRIALLCSEL